MADRKMADRKIRELNEIRDSELDHVVGGDMAPGLLGYEGQPGNQGG